MKRLKGDNRGLSLIEVLVTVTILAIIITPFLHSFVTAANTNSKAKKIHKATVVAQSVMEGFKVEYLDEIALQFNYPNQGFYVVPTGRINGGSSLINGLGEYVVGELCYDAGAGTYAAPVQYENPSLSGVVDKWEAVKASTYSEDMGVNSQFKGQSDGVYYFYLDSVKEDISEYDVLVKVDATDYRAGATGVYEHNADMLAQLPVIDLNQDAMCIQKESFTDAAVEYFHASFASASEDSIRSGLGRTITITVDKVRVGMDEKITVNAAYEYTYQYGGEIKEYSKTKICFDSMETGKELRSVYLYYYPLYSTSATRDRIIFENNEQFPINFYLMKQKHSSATDGDEATYKFDLTLRENGSTVDNRKTNVYTNLETNLFSGTSIPSTQYNLYWNNGLIDNLSLVAPQGIYAEEKTDRMFDIEVSVYEKGARASHYPEDMKLTTLEGSRIN